MTTLYGDSTLYPHSRLVHDMTRRYSQMYRTDKYSEHSSIIWPLSPNEIETNGVNGFQLAEQGFSSTRCSQQRNNGCHHVNPVISKRRKWSSQENKIVMECYSLSEPKITGYRKHMLSLWLQRVCLGYQNKD